MLTSSGSLFQTLLDQHRDTSRDTECHSREQVGTHFGLKEPTDHIPLVLVSLVSGRKKVLGVLEWHGKGLKPKL